MVDASGVHHVGGRVLVRCHGRARWTRVVESASRVTESFTFRRHHLGRY